MHQGENYKLRPYYFKYIIYVFELYVYQIIHNNSSYLT